MAEPTMISKLVAEFTGTFLLVFTIGCNVLSGQTVWAGVSIACALMVMVYACANSSGAHFNPAVSFALALAGKCPWGKAGAYMAAQLVGGIVAGFAYLHLFGSSFELGPTKGHSFAQAAFAEIAYTFMLTFVVLNTAASKANAGKNESFGIAIGFVIIAGAYSGGGISMGCFNPAVAVGIDVASLRLWTSLAYTVFELIGAAVAVALFWACRPEDMPRNTATEAQPASLVSKLISEAIGTYMLVLTVGLNVLGGSPAGAFSIACGLMCMIYALGNCSGAHFNPAVTVAIAVSGRDKELTNGNIVGYISAQIAGGVLAAISYMALKSGETFALKPDASAWSQVVVAEFTFTFVLAFVVLHVCTSDLGKLKEWYGFAIGMCVTAGGCAIGSISGGSLNPAVSVGIATAHLKNRGDFYPCLVYGAVELLAGTTAALVFGLTHLPKNTENRKP